MISIKWISKRQQELDDKEEKLERKEKELKLIYLDMVIKAKVNLIKDIDNLYFDAIK
jgi:hypothetical protein